MGLVIILVILVVLFFTNVRIVPQAHAFVVERLGAYKTTWTTGLHLKVPFIERVARQVSLKEQLLDSPPQPVITKDNTTIMEMNFGAGEGQSIEEIRENPDERLHNFIFHPQLYAVPPEGGETFGMLRRRAVDFMAAAKARLLLDARVRARLGVNRHSVLRLVRRTRSQTR